MTSARADTRAGGPRRRRSRDTIPPGRKTAFVLVMLAGIAVLFLGAEGMGRLYINLVYGVPGKSYGIYRSDPELGARHAESSYNLMRQFDDHGFQSPEDVMKPKPEGAARILVYGDTTAFSPNLDMEDTWPLAVQNVLREDHHPRTQVLNGGEDSWSIGHAFVRARQEIEDLDPDVTVIYAGVEEELNAAMIEGTGGDFARLSAAGDGPVIQRTGLKNNWLYRNSVTFKALAFTVLKWLDHQFGIAFAQPAEPDPLLLAHYQKVLTSFIELNEKHGTTTVFVIQAHGAGTPEQLRKTSYSRASADLARELGAIVLDAQEAVTGYDGDPAALFDAWGLRFSEKGAEVFARYLSDQGLAALLGGRAGD